MLLQLKETRTDAQCLSIFENGTDCTMHPFNYTLLRLTEIIMFLTQCHLSLLTQPTCRELYCCFCRLLKRVLQVRFFCSGSKTCPKWKFYKVLSYFTIILLLHGVICIKKYQHRFCFPTSFPLFVASLFFPVPWWPIRIITTRDVHYQVYHPHALVSL